MELKLFRLGEESGESNYSQQIIKFRKDTEGIENEIVNLYPQYSFEKFEGFGGAITDSAAYVYSLMDEKDKKTLIDTYFSKHKMNYRLVRIHMDSCDFSTEMYEAVSDPDDRELKSFSFERTEKYIIPMLEDAQRAASHRLEIMLSPWSPPAFMKTNGSRKNGGHLKEEYAGMWADCICRYISEFRNRGFYVKRISIQNEAKAVQTWDSCVYSAEQEKSFLENYLYPTLVRHGLDDTEVFIWDHNKERAFERAEQIVKGKTADMVSGVACHWYSGDHFENLDLLRRFYPDLKLIISESCIEYSKFSVKDEFENAARLSHEIIGDLSHGVTAFYDWNILLDEKGGPNHVGNFCSAPCLYSSEKGLIPQGSYAALQALAHTIKPCSAVLATSSFDSSLETLACTNGDGGVNVIIPSYEDDLIVNVAVNDKVYELEIRKDSATVLSLGGDEI